MDKRIMIAPSTDPAKNLDELIAYVREIENYADMLHCDIMDGEFVEKKNFINEVLDVVNAKTTLPFDVHLMVKSPEKSIEHLVHCGANYITVHYESFKNDRQRNRCIRQIKKMGALSGMSIKPETPIDVLTPFLEKLDLVLIMGVVPGKSGQEMIEDTIVKVAMLNKIKKDYKLNFKIEVDGGVNDKNCHSLIVAGANCLVSGNFVFKSQSKEDAINSLRV